MSSDERRSASEPLIRVNPLFCRVPGIGRRRRRRFRTAPEPVEDGPFAFIGGKRRIDRDAPKVFQIFDAAKALDDAVETVLDRLDVGPVIILVVIVSRNAHEPFATAGLGGGRAAPRLFVQAAINVSKARGDVKPVL